MKNYSIVLNVVLLIAVAVLYVLHFTGDKKVGECQVSTEAGTGAGTKIVYINTDTLLSNYLLSVELNEAFLKKQEERRTELNMKAKQLDKEANDFQRKLEMAVLYPGKELKRPVRNCWIKTRDYRCSSRK